MNPIKHLRRVATVLTGLVAATVAFATPAFAMRYRSPAAWGTRSGRSRRPGAATAIRTVTELTTTLGVTQRVVPASRYLGARFPVQVVA